MGLLVATASTPGRAPRSTWSFGAPERAGPVRETSPDVVAASGRFSEVSSAIRFMAPVTVDGERAASRAASGCSTAGRRSTWVGVVAATVSAVCCLSIVGVGDSTISRVIRLIASRGISSGLSQLGIWRFSVGVRLARDSTITRRIGTRSGAESSGRPLARRTVVVHRPPARWTSIDTARALAVTFDSPQRVYSILTSTNVAAPLANWITNRAGVFDWLGNVTVTNGINSLEPQRYFRINAP